jgi:hypothetical protein
LNVMGQHCMGNGKLRSQLLNDSQYHIISL